MVQLDARQHASLKAEAKRRGVSVAALVREAVDRSLETPRAEQLARAQATLGRFTDRAGATDVARNHDRYLFES